MSDGRSGVDRAYDVARSRIIEGVWLPGTLLSEAIVGSELGISRTPVHAAFLRLEAEGLLEIRRGQGALVPPISAADARDILEVRRALEIMAAERLIDDDAVPAATPDLVDCLALQSDAVDADDAASFHREDVRFHRLIVEHSANTLARGIHASIADREQVLRHQTLATGRASISTLLADHRALLDALERADAPGYARSLKTHLARHTFAG